MKRVTPFYLLFSASVFFVSGAALEQAYRSAQEVDQPPKKETDQYEVPAEPGFDPAKAIEEATKAAEAMSATQEDDTPEIDLKIIGSNRINFTYGKSFFISDTDRLAENELPSSGAVQRGLTPAMDMKMSMQGRIGDEISLNINFDQRENLSNNEVEVFYNSIEEKAFLQEMQFGNITADFGASELYVNEKEDLELIGVKAKYRIHDKVDLQTLAGFSQSLHETEIFRGNSTDHEVSVKEYRYAARQYYQLEPFLYYDDIASPPLSLAPQAYTRGDPAALNLFTSGDETPAAPLVNIDAGSLLVYMDDRNPKNDNALGAKQKRVNGNDLGNFHLLQEGKDFTIHYQSGRIRFVYPVPVESKVFVQYTRLGGPFTSDPTARTSNGKIETFLRYGKDMHEDLRRDGVISFAGSDDTEIVPDGVVNLDIYEVRGIYDLGVSDILEKDFRIELYSNDYTVFNSMSDLGYYSVDYEKGVITFHRREPFRNLQREGIFHMDDNELNIVYSETHTVYLNDYSRAFFLFNMSAIVRSFQLSRFNIVKESEKVRVNDVLLSEDYYFIDYQSGYFRFIDNAYPVIGPATQIEISYEYLPFGLGEQSYLAGLRAEYSPYSFIALGARAVYQGDFQEKTAPLLGGEPQSRFITGADMSLRVDEATASRWAEKVTGGRIDRLPLRLESYAEYAHSFYNANSAGVAIVDNMETSEDSFDAGLNARDWVLSAPPQSIGAGPCDRAPLYYRHYYDPNRNVSGLYGDSSDPFASPHYSQATGPYNIGESPASSIEYDQLSPAVKQALTLEFDFSQAPSSAAPFVAVNTQNLAQGGIDFSNYTVLEFSAKLDQSAALPAGVNLVIELGTLAEDTDLDGYLDTEDTGLDLTGDDANSNNIIDGSENWDEGEKNGRIDRDRERGVSEDRGYTFNNASCPSLDTIVGGGPKIEGYLSTVGNGALNSEDFNKSGSLENNENIISIDPAKLYVAYDDPRQNQIDPGGWVQYRIYLNFSAMDENQKRIFRSVENMRIYLTPGAGGELGKGRLMLHGLRLSGSLWKDAAAKAVAGFAETPLTDNAALRVSMINNFDNPAEYAASSFLSQRREDYENLYGERTTEEHLNTMEGTMKLEYNLDPTYEYALVKRTLSRSADLQHYEKIHIWTNNRILPADGASLLFRVGSGAQDYYQYENAISETGWNKITFNLNSPALKTGDPSLDNIQYMAVGIKRDGASAVDASGVVWVNDIYVSGVSLEADSAYTYSLSLSASEPLYTTKGGTPILAETSLTYFNKTKGADYRPIGLETGGLRMEEEQLHTQSAIFPFWKAAYGFSLLAKESTSMNPERGAYPGYKKEARSWTEHSLLHNKIYAPHILIGYADTQYSESDEIKSGEGGATRDYQLDIRRRAPSLTLTETLPVIFNTNIDYTLHSSIEYTGKNETTLYKNSSGVVSSQSNSEKNQAEHGKAAMRIRYKGFYIEPEHEYSRNLLLYKENPDFTNFTPPSGDFFVPGFESPPDFRFRSRSAGYRLKMSHDKLWAFSPSLSMSLLFREENFRDNKYTYSQSNYQRIRNPATTGKFNLSLPFIMRHISDNSLLKNIDIAFSREITLAERGLPFSTKTNLYDDPLALSRTAPSISSKTYNLFEYPFWHFLGSPEGEDYFARGRDFVRTPYSLENSSIPGEAKYAYDNSLNLSEWGSLSTFWNPMGSWSIRTLARVSQSARRENLGGLPSQQINTGGSIIQTFNLVELLDFWFWADPAHSSTLNLDLQMDTILYITQNRAERAIRPSSGISFEWINRKQTLTNLTFYFSLGFSEFTYREFLSQQSAAQDRLLYENMNIPIGGRLDFNNINYQYEAEYSKELPRLKRFLQNLTKLYLQYNPFYLAAITADLHNVDFDTIEYQPSSIRDLYLFDQRLDINLHSNVTGLFGLKLVYEVEKNPISEIAAKKVFSYQAGFGANILF